MTISRFKRLKCYDTFNTLLYYSIYTIKQPFSFNIFITFAKQAIKINTPSIGVHIFLNLYLSNHLKKPSKFYHHSMKCQIILPRLVPFSFPIFCRQVCSISRQCTPFVSSSYPQSLQYSRDFAASLRRWVLPEA